MYLVDIRAAGFRNLVPERIQWSPGTNLILGGNGEGKTNLLEAVAILANLRSFRASSPRQHSSHGAAEFAIDGRAADETESVQLRLHVAVGPPVQRELEVGGAPSNVFQYLQVLPVLALSGADRGLIAGPPAGRRALLDRFTFLLEPAYFEELRSYRRLLKQRNAALAGRTKDSEMEVWEGRLASAAAVIVGRRCRACSRLAAAFAPVYQELHSGSFPSISVNYRGDATIEAVEDLVELEERYRKRYNETRVRDRQTGFTGEGPHRHDVDLRANGKAVRHVLSSGQTKVAAAALRLASLVVVENRRAERLPVIVDDVDAELDPRVLLRLIGYLEDDRQLFLSSAVGDVLGTLRRSSTRFVVDGGAVTRQTGERVHE